MRGLDQDQAGRIEPERAKAMAMQPAVGAVRAQPEGRHDEEQWVKLRQTDLLLPPPPGPRFRAPECKLVGEGGVGVVR